MHTLIAGTVGAIIGVVALALGSFWALLIAGADESRMTGHD